jgi:hypothetical protein
LFKNTHNCHHLRACHRKESMIKANYYTLAKENIPLVKK